MKLILVTILSLFFFTLQSQAQNADYSVITSQNCLQTENTDCTQSEIIIGETNCHELFKQEDGTLVSCENIVIGDHAKIKLNLGKQELYFDGKRTFYVFENDVMEAELKLRKSLKPNQNVYVETKNNGRIVQITVYKKGKQKAVESRVIALDGLMASRQ